MEANSKGKGARGSGSSLIGSNRIVRITGIRWSKFDKPLLFSCTRYMKQAGISLHGS